MRRPFGSAMVAALTILLGIVVVQPALSVSPSTQGFGEFLGMPIPNRAPLHYIPKKVGHYSATDWRRVIDSTWGIGLSANMSRGVFTSWWNKIDQEFAAFQGHDPYIMDSIWAKYYPELSDVAHPVSKGRLAGILAHATRALRDGHTRAYDDVIDSTTMLPGVPILHMVNPYNGAHFGAGVTVLPDSTGLVYSAVPSHPLGLVPGDVILGYDRIRWPELLRELYAAELPMYGLWGGADEAMTHHGLMSVGMNWHLFDTMDIAKYSTGDTVHLPTSLMVGQNLPIWATEQLDVPGVVRPNPSIGNMVSWGIISGTTIGYIYVNGYDQNTNKQWAPAVEALVKHDPPTTGLIIDSRLNQGASGNGLALTAGGNALLFDSFVKTFRWDVRCNPTDHFAMCPAPGIGDSAYAIHGSYGYHRPIAILVGPVSISGGDFHPFLLALHPLAKVFGKPTVGAFGPVANMDNYLTDDIRMRYPIGNGYPSEQPGAYMTRHGFPDSKYFPSVDFQEVWLTKEGVAQGRDDVVEAAKAWILSRDADQDSLLNENDNCPNAYNPDQTDTNHDGIGDACCCVNLSGNVDCDPAEGVDISDLSALIDYLYITFTPLCCPNEANTDGQIGVDISDLTALIDYLYISFTPTAVCQ